jgi:reversibly glycosylated polypeptide/UDP-arabinopyranose mutase
MAFKVLVIPSCREVCLKAFLAAWRDLGDWDEIVLVEDNPTKTFDVKVDAHYSWAEIEETLGGHARIISRRDSAIRSFGFLMALRRGATHILTLDDDCYPHSTTPIFQAHLDRIETTPRWIPSVPGMRTRGMPYVNIGTAEHVVASMGLWSRIPDLDAIQSLNNLDFATNGQYQPPPGSRLIPAGQYLPVCGMNLCFKAEMVPLLFFPKMGEGSPYRRFDDIWAGIIFKRIIDHLGFALSVGEPFVAHQRASCIFTNLVKEAPGVAANETFWESVDRIPLTAKTPVDCLRELGFGLTSNSDAYIRDLGEYLQTWADLCSSSSPACPSDLLPLSAVIAERSRQCPRPCVCASGLHCQCASSGVTSGVITDSTRIHSSLNR